VEESVCFYVPLHLHGYDPGDASGASARVSSPPFCPGLALVPPLSVFSLHLRDTNESCSPVEGSHLKKRSVACRRALSPRPHAVAFSFANALNVVTIVGFFAEALPRGLINPRFLFFLLPSLRPLPFYLCPLFDGKTAAKFFEMFCKQYSLLA